MKNTNTRIHKTPDHARYAGGDPNECPCCAGDRHYRDNPCDLCDDIAHTGTPQLHDLWLSSPDEGEDEYREQDDPRWLAFWVDTVLT